MQTKINRSLIPAVIAAALSAAITAQAQQVDHSLKIKRADPLEQGDGTLSLDAKQAIEHGPLPFSREEANEKARKRTDHLQAPYQNGTHETVFPGKSQLITSAPIVSHINNRLTDPNSTPSDATGAIGPFSFIQLVNNKAGIFNRTTGAVIKKGTLNDLAGVGSAVKSFDPQVIWDPTTKRFYYVMASVFSDTDQRLSWGFSLNARPGNLTTAWCHYSFQFGSDLPDYPKLGDSRYFLIIGMNVFNTGISLGSQIIALSKPSAGTTCPTEDSFVFGAKSTLTDSTGKRVFTPVPANQIDGASVGYVVARNGGPLPANKLWFYNVTRDPITGGPVFGVARGVTVAGYSLPFDADQPGPSGTQQLATLDARLTQAVQAIDPRLGTLSFWTQHTIADSTGFVSAVRWYEIDPVPAIPVVKRFGTISTPGSFRFNASISSDRRVDGSTKAFGNNFVVQYSLSGTSIFPSIAASSSVNGDPNLSTVSIQPGNAAYKDMKCPTGGVCRWGDYSGMSPDPRPTVSAGVVWGTNQFCCFKQPLTTEADWDTFIFAVQP